MGVVASGYIDTGINSGQLSRYSDVLHGQGSIPGRSNDYLPHSTQNEYGTHPTHYPMGTGGSFPESKSAGA
jgi:hypothetical protein